MKTIFYNVKNIIYNFISFRKKTTIIGLGRWKLLECNNKIHRKVDWANLDHCGPCGYDKFQNK